MNYSSVLFIDKENLIKTNTSVITTFKNTAYDNFVNTQKQLLYLYSLIDLYVNSPPPPINGIYF